MRRSRHIQSPGPVGGFVGSLTCLPSTILQVAHPMAQGEHVVLTQVFDVANFKPTQSRFSQNTLDRSNIPVRKNVTVNKRRTIMSLCQRSSCDAVIQKYAARSQQLVCFSEVVGEHLLAHVLHHSNANQLVKRAMFLNITIIEHFDATEMLQTGAAEACIRQLGLWLTQRNA